MATVIGSAQNILFTFSYRNYVFFWNSEKAKMKLKKYSFFNGLSPNVYFIMIYFAVDFTLFGSISLHLVSFAWFRSLIILPQLLRAKRKPELSGK